MDENEKDHAAYEVSFLLKDDGAVKAVADLLRRLGAEITSEGPVERIPLAYRIKKETTALFGYFHFKAVPGVIPQIREELRVHPSVLRALVITPPLTKSRPKMTPRSAKVAVPPPPPEPPKDALTSLTNEALERKIEEILQEK